MCNITLKIKVTSHTPQCNNMILCKMDISHNYLYNSSVMKLNISKLFWYPTPVHCGYHYMHPQIKKKFRTQVDLIFCHTSVYIPHR